MQRLEVSGAVRPIYGSLGVKGLSSELLEINRMSVTRAFPYSRGTNVLPRVPQWRGKSKQQASFGSN